MNRNPILPKVKPYKSNFIKQARDKNTRGHGTDAYLDEAHDIEVNMETKVVKATKVTC